MSTLGGDSSLTGVDELNPVHELAPGFVAGARNKRFRQGKAADRPGIALLPWMKGDGTSPFGDVYGAALFAVPEDSADSVGQTVEWVIIAADQGIWRTRANGTAVSIPLPPGTNLTRDSFSQFIQANGSLILLRGLNAAPLQCTDFSVGFTSIDQQNVWEIQFNATTNQVQFPAHNLIPGEPVSFQPPPPPANPRPDFTYALPSNITAGVTYYVLDVPTPDTITLAATPGGTMITWNNPALKPDPTIYDGLITVLDGAQPIPNANAGLFAQNRLFLVNGKDLVAVSDIGDFTRYQPATAVFRINEGDSYTVQALYLYNQNQLVFLEDGAIRMATGISGDLSGAVGPLDLTKAYGIAAPRGIADAGTDLYWLNSELRVVNLQLTQLNQTQATDEALSDPLVQTFGRINAGWADRARLAVHDSYLYCALPLDDAELVSPTNLVPAGQTSSSSTPLVVTGLTAGVTYQWRAGANGGLLVNGTETLQGDCDFIAQGTSVSLYGYWPTILPVTDSLAQVLATGVNTGVAVYDFIKNAWCGSDEAPGVICVVDWIKMTLNGRKRLVFMGADGWLHLYGDSQDYPYEDEAWLAIDPYTDVVSGGVRAPQAGDTLQVNGGDILTATADPTNSPGHWGIGNGQAGTNLWQDANGTGGFNPSAANPWNAGTLTGPPQAIADGVRFPGAVTIKVNGTTSPDGPNAWAIVDTHGGNAIGPVPIESWVRTRGFPCSRLLSAASMQSLSYTSETNTNRFSKAALQLQAWAPNYTISVLTQGAGDATDVATNETRDRLKYFAPFDATDWNPTNTGNDYDNPNREDYSYQETGGGIFLQDGVPFDQLQEFVHQAPLLETGLWVQLDITNAGGHLELLAVALEAEGANQISGPRIK